MDKARNLLELGLLITSWLVLSGNAFGFLWIMPGTEGGERGLLIALATGTFLLAVVIHQLIRWVFGGSILFCK